MQRLTNAWWALLCALAACSSGSPAGGSPEGGADLSADLGAASDASTVGDAATSAVSHLRVHYPAGAHALSIRGDVAPLGWDTGAPASAAADGTYEYAITLPAGTDVLEWKPLLDDTTWSRGPNYVAHRGETVDVYPHFVTQAGTVVQLLPAFHSSVLQNTRVVWAYLPPTYAENARARFPVAYMHDGQNLFDVQPGLGPNGWRVDHALDVGAEDGSIRELIVVAPENAGLDREYEYTPTVDASETGHMGGGDLYLRMLVEELKPAVDGMLRTQPERATTGIIGSSLGGLISVYAGVKQPAIYGLVGALSPSTWWDNTVIIGDVMGMGPVRPDRVYVDCGDSGPSNDDVTDTTQLAAAFEALGYTDGVDLRFLVQPGGQHSETYWAMRVPGALAMLFGPRSP